MFVYVENILYVCVKQLYPPWLGKTKARPRISRAYFYM